MVSGLVGPLVEGLTPHLPRGVTVSAVSDTTLGVRRRLVDPPAGGYGGSGALRFDLREAGATDVVDAGTVSALLFVLERLQVDLSEWLGRAWPPFPSASTADAGTPAVWWTGAGSAEARILGYCSPSGWSLRIMRLDAHTSADGRRAPTADA